MVYVGAHAPTYTIFRQFLTGFEQLRQSYDKDKQIGFGGD